MVLKLIILCRQLSDKYHDFVTASEKEEFTAMLQETEDWLYEDGEDETKGVYVAKLEELKKVTLVLLVISQVDCINCISDRCLNFSARGSY